MLRARREQEKACDPLPGSRAGAAQPCMRLLATARLVKRGTLHSMHRTGNRIWLIIIAVLIAAGVVAYFVGSGVERSARFQQLADAKTQLQEARSQIAALQSAKHLLGAGVWTYRAAVALDNRNFGVANDAAANALTNVNAVEAGAAGLDGKQLTALQNEAAGVKISVARNLASQRAQLLRLAAGINAMIAQSAPKT